jgi:hypothetical protein
LSSTIGLIDPTKLAEAVVLLDLWASSDLAAADQELQREYEDVHGARNEMFQERLAQLTGEYGGEQRKKALIRGMDRDLARSVEDGDFVPGMSASDWARSKICGGLRDSGFWPTVEVCPAGRLDFIGNGAAGGDDDCPPGITGCRDKMFCDFERAASAHPGKCTVISVGSNDQWEFEEDVFRRAPQCSIHTYDGSLNSKNTHGGSRPIKVPKAISARTTLHEGFLGFQTHVPGQHDPELFSKKRYQATRFFQHRAGLGEKFWSWGKMLERTGHSGPPSIAKVDCEGCELGWLLSVLDSGEAHTQLPPQIDFELHTRYVGRQTDMGNILHVLRRLWLEAGFALVHSIPGDGGCELLLARLRC